MSGYRIFSDMIQDKTFYLTKNGLKKLKAEYEKLKELKRTKTDEEAPSAFSSEELSAEFVSFRDDMDLFDVKFEEFECILKNYEIIKYPPKEERDKVCLGATVDVEVDGKKDEFVMVGTLEANPSKGRISNESPVGKAIIGLSAGEEAVISSPVRVVYKIKKVSYK